MWRRRRKRCTELSRQLALGRLEDALGRVDEAQRQAEKEAAASGNDQPAAAAGAAGARVPAPRGSRPGWLFPRAQEKQETTTRRETSDPGQAPRDARSPRL